MAEFDYPNEEELQPYIPHDYDLVDKEYPIEENNAESTYNQFIQLRDTLIYSDKKYNGKAWAKLIIWEKEETVEVLRSNVFRLWFEPDWETSKVVSKQIKGPYVEYNQESADINGVISCVIKKDWRYRVIHKEELDITNTNLEEVVCYVDIIRNGSIPVDKKGWIAVFRWKSSWTLSWTTSWTSPNWTCTVSFKLWKLFQKMTTWWFAELDLRKDDVLVLRMKDQTPDTAWDWSPRWNNLTLQPYSNFMSVEYIDLPYDKEALYS